MKHIMILVTVAYIAIWWLTAYSLERDEQDEKMKSLWFMVSLLWPLLWVFACVVFIVTLFKKDERDMR